MAQMFEQLQQLGQQLSDQREMLQQIQETQRQQSQVQMETFINLGAVRVAKTTSDAHDFQTKAFSEMRGQKSDDNAESGWVYKFRIEAARCFRQVAAILDWAEDRRDRSNQIAVQAESVESPEKQRRTIERSSRSKVHESSDVHTKDARSTPKFIGHCFWCGAHGHTKSDCRKKAAGRPRTALSPTIPTRKGRAESIEKWPDTDEEALCRSIGFVSRHEM